MYIWHKTEAVLILTQQLFMLADSASPAFWRHLPDETPQPWFLCICSLSSWPGATHPEALEVGRVWGHPTFGCGYWNTTLGALMHRVVVVVWFPALTTVYMTSPEPYPRHLWTPLPCPMGAPMGLSGRDGGEHGYVCAQGPTGLTHTLQCVPTLH